MKGRRVAATKAAPAATGESVHIEPAPNIVNIANIYAFSENFVTSAGRPEAEGWFRHQLPKFLLRDPRLSRRLTAAEIAALQRKAALPAWAAAADAAGRPLHRFDPYLERWDDGDTDFVQALHGVREWLAALPEGDRHLRRLGRMSVPEAIAASRVWRHRVAKRREDDCPEDWAGLETVWRSPLGPKFVRLTTAAALQREGTLMCNCLRHGWYDEAVRSGKSEIYSLRDTHNKPHVTIQVDAGRVAQVKGKQNTSPAERWQPYVNEFIAIMGWPGARSRAAASRYVYGDRVYATVAEVIADLPQLVDLDAALFDSRLFAPILRFIAAMQPAAAALATEHQQTIVAFLHARVEANGGYRLIPEPALAIELPRGDQIGETRVELAGAVFALADHLAAASEAVAALCRQVLRNVLVVIERRPATLYRLTVATVAGCTAGPQALARFIAISGLADEFYRIRRAALEYKRRRMIDAVIELKRRLGQHRAPMHEDTRARALNLIRVQAPRFFERTLHEALVARRPGGVRISPSSAERRPG